MIGDRVQSKDQLNRPLLHLFKPDFFGTARYFSNAAARPAETVAPLQNSILPVESIIFPSDSLRLIHVCFRSLGYQQIGLDFGLEFGFVN